MTKEENAMELLKQLEDLFEGRDNDSDFGHFTGDLELCGKTADEVLKQIKEKKDKE